MWERRRKRKAGEEARRREFELAVGGREQLQRMIAHRLEEWFREKGGKPAPLNAFDYQAKTMARDLVHGWVYETESTSRTPAEHVEQALSELLETLDASKALGLFIRR